MTKKELLEQQRRWGAKGGKSRSKKKLAALRVTIEKCARPGKAVAKLRRDVESKIARNRREWLLAGPDERLSLDVKFDKLIKVLNVMDRKKNGSA